MTSILHRMGVVLMDNNKNQFDFKEQVGDIYYIENGEKYFDENGVLNRKILENETDLFL